jgi:hypothetical protein
MAISGARVSVTSTATLIAQNTKATTSEGDYASLRAVAKNMTASAAIFLGGSGVTTATGFQWDFTDGAFEFELEPGEGLYGIVASVTQTVHVLTEGR